MNFFSRQKNAMSHNNDDYSFFESVERYFDKAAPYTTLPKGLLKQIKEHGSISKAAKEMKMSYKKAWELVNSMNNESSSDLVKRKTGGIGGGGAIVSKKGLEAIKLFEELTEECGAFFNEKMKTINL